MILSAESRLSILYLSNQYISLIRTSYPYNIIQTIDAERCHIYNIINLSSN